VALIFSDKSLHHMFIGLHKIGLANYTQWINNATVNFSAWGPNQPQDLATEDCAIIYEGAWHDLPCSSSIHFICEQNQTYNQLTTSMLAPSYWFYELNAPRLFLWHTEHGQDRAITFNFARFKKLKPKMKKILFKFAPKAENLLNWSQAFTRWQKLFLSLKKNTLPRYQIYTSL